MNYYWTQTVIAGMRIYLKEWLDLLGISQAELAKESGISENQISRIASGKNRRLPRAGTLDAIATALGVPERRLLFMTPPEDEEEYHRKMRRISFEDSSSDIEEDEREADEEASATRPDLSDWLNSPDATIYGKEATPEMKAHIKSLIEMVMKEKVGADSKI